MDQLATYIIVVREGVEALLLLMMFNRAAVDADQRKWIISGALAGIAVPMAFVTLFFSWAEKNSPYLEIGTNIAAGAVLLYVFFWSKSIMAHVKEHVGQMTTFNDSVWAGPMVMFTSWFIVGREMIELSLMLINTYHGNPTGTISAILGGIVTLAVIAAAFGSMLKKINIPTFFRASSWAFGAMGLYYLWEGCEKIVDTDWSSLLQ
jgi:high-affinity Fe2+/Pb2+ permease